MAGTGSVVCSQAADGSFLVSGGRGWILGDHGGAARLGRAALEHYVAEAGGIPAVSVTQIFGDSDWRFIVRMVHATPNPAPLLARAAPLLTSAAEGGQGWAVEHLEAEMTALAATAARHIEWHLARTSRVQVALSGGVWSSPAAQSALTTAFERAGCRPLTVTRSLADPLDGAVRLAESLQQ